MVAKLAIAQEMEKIHMADSCPYWLQPDQYAEIDSGFVFLAHKAPLLMKIAGQKAMHPLGLVVLEGDQVNAYMNREGICEDCMEFTLTLFKTHVQCWLSLIELWDQEGKLRRA